MTQIQHETDPANPVEGNRYARASWTVSHGKSTWGGLPLDPASMLFVSLFLVLFAFFAVMNTIAVERPREAAEVLESLQKVFGGIDSQSVAAAEVFAASRLAGDNQMLAAYDKMVADFPDVRVVVSTRGDEIATSLSLNRFFVRDTSRLAPSRELFLKSIATISSQTPATPLTITIIFPDDENDNDGQRRVAALAGTLGKYGASSDHLTVTGSNIAAGQIRLIVGRR